MRRGAAPAPKVEGMMSESAVPCVAPRKAADFEDAIMRLWIDHLRLLWLVEQRRPFTTSESPPSSPALDKSCELRKKVQTRFTGTWQRFAMTVQIQIPSINSESFPNCRFGLD